MTTHALDNARRSLRRAVWRAPRACPQPLWSWRRADPRAGRPAAQRTARSAPLQHARAHDPRCPAGPVAHTSSRRDTRPRMSLRHTAAHAHASSCTRPQCHGSRTRMRTPRLLGKLNRHGISWQCSAPAPHPHCISHRPVSLSLAAIQARRPPPLLLLTARGRIVCAPLLTAPCLGPLSRGLPVGAAAATRGAPLRPRQECSKLKQCSAHAARACTNTASLQHATRGGALENG